MKTYTSVCVSLLLSVVFFYITSVDGTVLFTFTQPSSNCITIHSTAVYKCSLDGVPPGDTVVLTWTVNGNSSSLVGPFQSYIDSVNITATGIGTHTLTLTIPGNTGLNGTIVECGAFGQVDGSVFINTSTSDPLLVLVAVPRIRQLSLKPNKPFDFMSNWKRPYMCGSDINYMYNVTVRDMSTDNIISENFTHLTQYNQSGLGFGTYTMSVTAIVDELQGDMENLSINIERGDVEWTMELTRVNEVLLAYISTTNNEPHKLLRIEDVPIDLDSLNSSDLSADLSNIGKVKGVAILVLNYNESQIHSDNNYTIDTFNVKGLSIIDSYDNGSVCFQCIYHSYADSSQGCTVKYSSSDGTVHHSFNISRDVSNMCINNISSSTYNITVYDMDELVSPAYQINNQFIHVLQPSTDSTSSVTSSTSETPSPTTSTDSTPSTATTQSPSDSGPPFVTIIIIVFAILLIIVLIIAIVILVFCIWKRGRNKLKSPIIHCQKSNISNYIEPHFDDDSSRPVAPLSTTNNMETEINFNSSENEEYSRLNRTVQPQGNLSDGIYNKLQREKPLPESLTHHTTDNEQYSTLPGGVSKANITEPELTYKLLITNLASRISHKWYQFGQALAITPPMLKEIQENHPNNDRDKLCDVIQEWMDSNPRPFTWATLQTVLTIINEAHLLQSIEESCV